MSVFFNQIHQLADCIHTHRKGANCAPCFGSMGLFTTYNRLKLQKPADLNCNFVL